jgi:NhaP-type Na+/H+ or K+/H+ antiporter
MDPQTQLQLQAERDTLNRFIDQAMAASWPLFAITAIIFLMRTISRFFYTEAAIGWEDHIISVSWVRGSVACYLYCSILIKVGL